MTICNLRTTCTNLETGFGRRGSRQRAVDGEFGLSFPLFNSLLQFSLIRWQSNEGLLNWPDLLSDPSIMGNTIQKLKRGRTSRHLGLEAPLAPEGDVLTPVFPQPQARYFSASGKEGV